MAGATRKSTSTRKHLLQEEIVNHADSNGSAMALAVTPDGDQGVTEVDSMAEEAALRDLMGMVHDGLCDLEEALHQPQKAPEGFHRVAVDHMAEEMYGDTVKLRGKLARCLVRLGKPDGLRHPLCAWYPAYSDDDIPF